MIARNIRSNSSPRKAGGAGTGRLLGLAAALFGLLHASAGCAAGKTISERGKDMTSTPSTTAGAPAGKEIATLAGGCFWCTEAIFRELKGVEKVEPGYAGGHVVKPSYDDVCTGTTGHAESIRIVFDPKAISFHDLLAIFFTVHDPTTLNRQGADIGTQYRSSIFFHSPAQKETAQKVIKEIEHAHIWPSTIVTEIVPFTNFYPAEEYHHNYFERNGGQPYCRAVIAPKVAKFRAHYREKLKR